MDRLPATAKRLLQAAAVIGKDVALPLLQAVTEGLRRPCTETSGTSRPLSFSTRPTPHRPGVHLQACPHPRGSVSVPSAACAATVPCTHCAGAGSAVPRGGRDAARTAGASLYRGKAPEQAIPYWQRAGQRASRALGQCEAISHFTKGLELLKSLPERQSAPNKNLHCNLPLARRSDDQGPYSPRSGRRLYPGIRVISAGGRSAQFSALVSLSRLYLNQARVQKARELAEQCFTLAQRVQDPAFLQEAHRMLGADLVLARRTGCSPQALGARDCPV